MSRTVRNTSVVLLLLTILLLNGIAEVEAAPKSNEFGQFFNRVGDKIVQSAATIKDYLVELFYRLRALFLGHTESTHQETTLRGCGYASDDKPAIYNKHKPIAAKIKGGDDAIWHTW